MARKPKFIVGLGASAGGLEALELFFDHAPEDSGGAFVVVMHLSRDFKSMLDELLARHTRMPVCAAEDDIEIAPDTVYVIQPGMTVAVEGTKLVVSNRPSGHGEGAATTVDLLFESIAKHWGNKGGGVVLSGSGSDSAQGIAAIHRAGGFTCAQAPETAKFDSMPLAAIATDAISSVEAPEELATTVVEGILLPSIQANPRVLSDHDAAMKKIVDAVVGATSLDATKYKHSTFERRVRRRMMDLQLGSLSSYASKIAEDPSEAQRLSDALLIGVTDFFRDEEAFECIKEKIIPEMISNAHDAERPIRIRNGMSRRASSSNIAWV